MPERMRRATALSLDFRLWGLALLVAGGCAAGDGDPLTSAAPQPAGETCFELPKGTQLPRFGTNGKTLVLSYVKRDTTPRTELRTRSFADRKWSEPDTLAAGENWFVNWADFPSVVPVGDAYFFHYLAYAGAGTYDYDIRYGAGGREAGILHQDGVAAEHGFLSTAPLPNGSLQLTWLDGRFTKTGEPAGIDDHGHRVSGGAMSLRTATLDASGAVTARTELDHRVCDCCNTTTVAAGNQLMVAYRNRTEDEIRDIYYVTNGGSGWSEPRPVHTDNWEVTGCPVNGPALAANESGSIAVAWYTAAEGVPRIRFARFNGTAFEAPLLIDDREPLGRVDLKMGSDGTAYLLGLASTDDPDRAAITLWTIGPDGTVAHRVLAETAAARSSGFPRLALEGGELLYSYTVVDEDAPFVRICTLPLTPLL